MAARAVPLRVGFRARTVGKVALWTEDDQMKTVEALLSAGGKVDMKDSKERTPLDIAQLTGRRSKLLKVLEAAQCRGRRYEMAG